MQVGGRKMIISIVGKSGSGKSSLAQLLQSYSDKICYLNIDEVGHQALLNQNIITQLVHTFHLDLKNNCISRRQLGDIVFNNHHCMKQLTDITWEYMEKTIDHFIEENKHKIIILDWILLPKTKYFSASDIKILVQAPFELRLNRAIKRDNITSQKFIEREQASLDYDVAQFDYIIENLDFEESKKKVKKIYDKSIVSRKL